MIAALADAVPGPDPEPDPREDAAMAAALLAVDPAGLGGVALRAGWGPARDAWLARLRALLPADAPWRRLPPGVPDTRLLGGLDLAATLRAGRPVADRGLLAEAAGGVLVVPMAERLAAATAARLTAALDDAALDDAGPDPAALDAAALDHARPHGAFAVVALDEGAAEDERPPPGLLDRLALLLSLPDQPLPAGPDARTVAAARALLPRVTCPEPLLEALCGAAAALGIASCRAPLLALRVARAAAALAGAHEVTQAAAALAARLVLAPRATRLPAAAPPEAPPPEAPPPEAPPPDSEGSPDEAPADGPPPDANAEAPGDGSPDPPPDDDRGQPAAPPAELVLAAARAAIPPGLLALLRPGAAGRPRSSGRSGALRRAARRGRPIGARPGDPRGGGRIALLETLTAAAPWQPIRRAETGATAGLQLRPADIRIRRFRERAESTAIFAVDASGSQATARLAEAKGAVELLLADCYVRRDRVALIAFRGTAAELLLPPTASLVRAKRGLAGLPGGGGTPLAAGIDAALALAETVRRGGRTPLLVLLTDGRANVGRDGAGGRPRAAADALAAAARWRAAGAAALLVDTATRPTPEARALAAAMAATYLALPNADAGMLSRAVRAAGLP